MVARRAHNPKVNGSNPFPAIMFWIKVYAFAFSFYIEVKSRIVEFPILFDFQVIIKLLGTRV